MSETNGKSKRQVRYAVVGLGHIAQVAVLPAFANAENSTLVGLVTGDPRKRDELQRRYDVSHVRGYDDFEVLLREAEVDAVYIAVPNHAHAEYTRRAAAAGVHVLCEKPMAVTEAECKQMIDDARANNVKLMVAYRLHFEAANMAIVEHIQKGEIGEPRVFQSAFTQMVQPGDIRLEPIARGGGSAYDMGIYCINAARYLFRAEPTEVSAFTVQRRSGDGAYDETMSAVLRFPEDRLASFTSSFGSHRYGQFTVIGTEGRISAEPAYEYAKPIHYSMTLDEDEARVRSFAKRDQFAPELIYFSQCILEDRNPEPGGLEGLADVRIVRALHESAAQQRPIIMAATEGQRRPGPEQVITRPGIEKPPEINASAPSDPGE